MDSEWYKAHHHATLEEKAPTEAALQATKAAAKAGEAGKALKKD